MNTDKKSIWTECPHCARKHLLAAYALFTQNVDNLDNSILVGTFRLLLARAEIAITEAQAGYTGNASLASGCLAAAECIADSKEAVKYLTNSQPLKLSLRQELRGVRFDIDQMNLDAAIAGLSRLLAVNDIEARAAAHLVEARRECPEIWEDYLGDFRGGYRHSDRGHLLEMLVPTVRYLEETYELGTGSGNPTPPDLNASARVTDSNAKLMAATESLLATPEGRAEAAAFGQTMGAIRKEARKTRRTNG